MAGRTAAAGLTAEQVRAYRILASGLTRHAASALDLSGWPLGFQDRDGSAVLALAARLPTDRHVTSPDAPAGSGSLAMAWTLRGSPHVHRRSDLKGLAAALWPADEADAAARLSGDAARLHADGADPLDAFRAVADAMRAVITTPMVKGEASAAVTAALEPRYSGLCAGCGSVHVRELLFRLAALPAAIGAVPNTKPVVLAPLSRPFPRPDEQRGLPGPAAEFYRMYGAAAPSDVGAHLGTSARNIAPALPQDLVSVTVDCTASRARAADLDAIAGADLDSARAVVRLLPPSDPLLQPRDRAVLTTNRDRQKALWPALGSPGAVLAGGGLAGIWRTRTSGKALTVRIYRWRELSTAELAAVEQESLLVGAQRGAARTTLLLE